jgi:hypothetical protein
MTTNPPNLTLVPWEGEVAHARRTAREALPQRLPDPPRPHERRIGLKSRLRARERVSWKR